VATGAKDLFGCPYCGFRVNPVDEACPRCGSKFTDNTKFECPFCGELVPQGSIACPTCHVDFSDFEAKTEKKPTDDSIDSLLMEIIRLESEQVKHEDKRLSCPNCSWLLTGAEDKCPKCGRSFAEDVTFMCPVCGSMVSTEADKCPDCGAVFVGEEEEAGTSAEEHAEVSSKLSEILTVAQEHMPETVEEVRAPEPQPEPGPEPVCEAPPEPAEEPAPKEPEVAPEPEPEKEEPEPAPVKKAPKQRKLKAKTPRKQ